MESIAPLDASQAKEMLGNGRPIENQTIADLTWSKHTFNDPVVLTDCSIDTLNLSNCIFHAEVTLRRCKIKNLIVSGSTFEKKADFKAAIIGRIRAQEVTFQEGLNCSGVRLSGSFHKSKIHGKAEFDWATFAGGATFSEVEFLGELDFRTSQVSGDSNFENALCHGVARFDATTFNGEVKMSHTTWQDDLIFCKAQVKLGLDLTFSKMLKKVDLRDITVGRSIKLWRLELGPEQGFRFVGLVAAEVSVDRDTLEGHVQAENEEKYRGAASEYGFLRNIFQQTHRYDDEDWAYYQYKRMRRKGIPLGWNPAHHLVRGLDYLFLDRACGYGTRPFRTLLACLLMVVVFALYYFVRLPAATVPEDYGLGSANKLVYSFDLSLQAFSGTYTELHGGLRILGIVEYMLGIVFLGLFVVALSRKVIR